MRAWLLLFALVAPACLWHSYAEIMRVHLDVLSGMADKARYNADAGQRPSSNDVTELTYPLERARGFAESYRSYRERESYRRFVEALDAYQTLVTAIDAARGDAARWESERGQIRALFAAWAAAAARTRQALARE